jgi:hypothetical protein
MSLTKPATKKMKSSAISGRKFHSFGAPSPHQMRSLPDLSLPRGLTIDENPKALLNQLKKMARSMPNKRKSDKAMNMAPNYRMHSMRKSGNMMPEPTKFSKMNLMSKFENKKMELMQLSKNHAMPNRASSKMRRIDTSANHGMPLFEKGIPMRPNRSLCFPGWSGMLPCRCKWWDWCCIWNSLWNLLSYLYRLYYFFTWCFGCFWGKIYTIRVLFKLLWNCPWWIKTWAWKWMVNIIWSWPC